jgi:hypothetical protein
MAKRLAVTAANLGSATGERYQRLPSEVFSLTEGYRKALAMPCPQSQVASAPLNSSTDRTLLVFGAK